MKLTPWDNPMGTDGVEFIAHAAPDPAAPGRVLETMGSAAIARHRRKKVTLHRQGGINLVISAEADSSARRFARLPGPSLCAAAFRVRDAVVDRDALDLGARGFDSNSGLIELDQIRRVVPTPASARGAK